MKMSDFFMFFLRYLKDEKRYSPNTISSYSIDLAEFEQFLNDIETQPINVTKLIIKEWLMELNSRGLAAKTVNRKISSLKSLYNYYEKMEMIKASPCEGIKLPKIPKRLPEYYEQNDIVGLLDNLKLTGKNRIEDQKHLMFMILYHTGVRRAELISIEVNNIDLKEKELKVLGKRKKERILPLVDELAANIQFYINTYSPIQLLFYSKLGKKVYPAFVNNLVRDLLGKISTKKKRSPHQLRHSIATHLLNSGADLNAIKEFLGHESLAATQIYTHNNLEKLKEIHKLAHPKG